VIGLPFKSNLSEEQDSTVCSEPLYDYLFTFLSGLNVAALQPANTNLKDQWLTFPIKLCLDYMKFQELGNFTGAK
jgi:hypothetical protein